MKVYNEMGRDNARSPMQWSAGENGGFSKVEPWLMVNPNYREINVESNWGDDGSVLNFYKKMIRFRKEHLSLVYGDFQLVFPEDEAVFAYYRKDEGETFFVVSNFTGREQSLDFDSTDYDLAVGNYDYGEDFTSLLRPYEARVYCLRQS